jgi:hypothetical protein
MYGERGRGDEFYSFAARSTSLNAAAIAQPRGRDPSEHPPLTDQAGLSPVSRAQARSELNPLLCRLRDFGDGRAAAERVRTRGRGEMNCATTSRPLRSATDRTWPR